MSQSSELSLSRRREMVFVHPISSVRHFTVERGAHMLKNKEVVVNTPTLICQEFCRTRTQGETTEETAGGAALPYNLVHQVGYALEYDAHTCAPAGQHFERFLARVDVLPKLPNRVARQSLTRLEDSWYVNDETMPVSL